MGPIGTPPPPQGDSHRITTLLASKDWGWGQSRSYQAVPQARQLCTPSPSGPSVESLTPPWSADPLPPPHTPVLPEPPQPLLQGVRVSRPQTEL